MVEKNEKQRGHAQGLRGGKIMPRVKRNHPWHYEKTSRPRREEINEMADRFSEEQTGACDAALKVLRL